MFDDINVLIKIQEIDKKIIDLEIIKKSIPNTIQEYQIKTDEFKNNVDSFKNNLNLKQIEKKNLELELAKIEENIKKHNIELNSVKSNEKYKAIVDIINNEKINKSYIEDKILLLLEEIDVLIIDFEKMKNILKDKENEFNVQKENLNDKDKKLDLEIKDLYKNRENEVLRFTNIDILKLYDGIRFRNKNIGLSQIDMERSSCSSCYMHLPFQKVNDVLSSKEPILCESCSKILYVLE